MSLVARGGARGGRERPAHRDRGHREDERAQNQPPGSRRDEPRRGRAAAREIERARRAKSSSGLSGGRNGHNRFERCIEKQRLILPIGPRPEQEAADAEAANEDGEDGGGGRRRCAEDQPELPQPATW